jgi:hypothetical protein
MKLVCSRGEREELEKSAKMSRYPVLKEKINFYFVPWWYIVQDFASILQSLMFI